MTVFVIFQDVVLLLMMLLVTSLFFKLSSKYVSKKENDNYLYLRKKDEFYMEKSKYKLNHKNLISVYSEDNVNTAYNLNKIF